MRLPDDGSFGDFGNPIRRHALPPVFHAGATHAEHLDAVCARLDFELVLSRMSNPEVLIVHLWSTGMDQAEIAQQLTYSVALVKDVVKAFQRRLRDRE